MEDAEIGEWFGFSLTTFFLVKKEKGEFRIKPTTKEWQF